MTRYKYYLKIKKNEAVIHAPIWMYLENDMLNLKCEAQR